MIDRECPDPDQIAFGSVTATGKLFGARATYSCQHGYHVVGLQSRTCQADGQWAGTAPACKQNSKYYKALGLYAKLQFKDRIYLMKNK